MASLVVFRNTFIVCVCLCVSVCVCVSACLYVCVCVCGGEKQRGREESMGERDVVTETREGLVGVIKAKGRQTHTHAGHGLTNHSLPHHFVFAMYIS